MDQGIVFPNDFMDLNDRYGAVGKIICVRVNHAKGFKGNETECYGDETEGGKAKGDTAAKGELFHAMKESVGMSRRDVMS